MDLARRGFAAWQRGDLETIEEMLDPGVQWSWYETGNWDCHSREDVMRRLRELYEQGISRSELEFLQAGSDAVIVVAHPDRVAGPDLPEEAATIVTFRGGRVVDMQDYRTRQEALAAAALM
jgi:ketosteroid isomerase-like protein